MEFILIPLNLKISIVPSLNPDGLYKIIKKIGRFSISDVPKNTSTESGRFNANKVDLNRNFDCRWKSKSMWKGNVVSAGTKAFSEPESMAIKNFILKFYLLLFFAEK